MDLTAAAAADVVFAQKATAIVKSAGMDPKSIDLETFRLNAPLIFSHAYSAIFREELYTVLHENSNMEDKILNAQLVLDGLYSRTRIPLLQQIKGNDICYDTNRAVDVVVHVLFSEGQRLWLEKLKQKSSPSRAVSKAAVDPSNSSSSSIELPQDTTTATSMMMTKVNSSAVAHNQHHSDYDDDDFHSDDVLEEQIRSSWKDLHELKESSKHKQAYVSPLDMEQLISRIAYLEDRLKRRKLQRKKKKKNMVLMLPGSHRMRYTKDSDNDAERRIDEDTRQVGVVPAIAMAKKRRSKRTNKAIDALLRDLDDTQQQQDIHLDYDYHHHHHHHHHHQQQQHSHDHHQ